MESIKRVPVVQQVVESIKGYLFAGEIEVGERLPPEKEFCEELEVGRGTLREAYRMLESTGYIELKPGKGAFAARVREVELEEVLTWFTEHEVETRDFLEVREAIEPVAVRLAISRCVDEEIKKLQQIHETFIEAVKGNNVSEIGRLDERFHSKIMEYSRNKLFISISKQIERSMKNFRVHTFYIPQNAENAILPHQRILEAFQNRKPEEGERSMRAHLRLIEEDLEKTKKM